MLFAVVALLLLPSASLASSSTCQSYNPQTCQAASSTTATESSTTSTSTLPFTGLDVVLLAAGGAALLAGGLIVRRISRGVR